MKARPKRASSDLFVDLSPSNPVESYRSTHSMSQCPVPVSGPDFPCGPGRACPSSRDQGSSQGRRSEGGPRQSPDGTDAGSRRRPGVPTLQCLVTGPVRPTPAPGGPTLCLGPTPAPRGPTLCLGRARDRSVGDGTRLGRGGRPPTPNTTPAVSTPLKGSPRHLLTRRANDRERLPNPVSVPSGAESQSTSVRHFSPHYSTAAGTWRDTWTATPGP